MAWTIASRSAHRYQIRAQSRQGLPAALKQLHDRLDAARLKQMAAAAPPHGLDREEISKFYPWFGNIKKGRLQWTLPPRAEIVGLADELGLTIDEINELMAAAGYQAEPHEPGSPYMQAAVRAAASVLDALPYPAYLIDQGWFLHGANAAFCQEMGIPPQAITYLVGNKLTLLDALFDARLQAAKRIANYQAFMQTNVAAFRKENLLSLQRPWFQQLEARLAAEHPLFVTLWAQTQQLTPPPPQPVNTMLIHTPTGHKTFRSVRISVADTPYPLIIALMP